jgi:hypothetical protein
LKGWRTLKAPGQDLRKFSAGDFVYTIKASSIKMKKGSAWGIPENVK